MVKRLRFGRLQAGVTLLELIVALGVMMSFVSGLWFVVDWQVQSARNAAVAQHMATVGDATQQYVRDNYSSVAAVATATQPALVRISTLITAGYLTTGFGMTNAQRQDVCALVLQPSAGQLIALVVAEGGNSVNDADLNTVAGMIGGAGGAILSSATSTLTGSAGTWSQAVGNFANANNAGKHCDGATAGAVTLAAGHNVMAVWFTGGDITSGFLYRSAVAGRPELNQMQTNLDMNNNAINNAATIALTTIVTSGSACATNGVVARDTNGMVMSCQSGTWKPQGSAYWQDPVATFGALPTCNAGAAWSTRVVQTPTTGTGPRAYTCNGASWQALAVDDSGNISIAGTATINSLAGNLTVTPTATIGAACAPNGRLAQDGNGLILSCQSGSWRRVGSGLSAVDALALQQAAANRSLTCTLPLNDGPVGFVSPHLAAFVRTTVSWDSAGNPTVLYEQLGIATGSYGWWQASSITSTAVNFPTASISRAGFTCSGFYACGYAPVWASVSMTANVTAGTVTYTLSASATMNLNPFPGDATPQGTGSCSATMTLS